MVSTTPATALQRANVPNQHVLNAINPVVSAILRSPLHPMMSGSVLLLTFTGRHTGRKYTIPVAYIRDGKNLVLFTDRSWRKNLAAPEGAPVTVRIQGRDREGTAVTVDDPEASTSVIERLIAQVGPRSAARLVGLKVNAATPPTHDQLVQAMRGHALISVTLDL